MLVVVMVLALLASLAAAQVLVTALPLNPTSLDPHRAIEGYSFMVTNQLYDTLVRLGDDGAVEPGLALAWSRPEPTVLRLELRRGVRFHDGRPLDAAAVAASLRRLADPATGARGAFLVADIDDILVIDDHTLDLISDPPFVPLLANLTFPATAIVPPGAGPGLGRAPVGTGPFRFVAWREGEVVELAADPDYWGGAPALAGVRYRVIPEAAARLIAFRAGDLHLVHDLAADAFLALEGEPGVELGRYPSDRTTYLGFNMEHPVLGDPRVRSAIAHALDRRLLVDALFSGLALAPVGPLSPLVRYALDAPDDHPYDPARARELLRQAGAEGARFVLHLATDGGLEDVAQVVQAALAEVGLRIELRIQEFPTHFETVTSPDGELTIGFWGSDTLDPHFMLDAALHSREIGNNNTSRYASGAYDALLALGATTEDGPERAAAYRAAQMLVLTDLPLLPLYHHVGTYAKRGGLEGERLPGSSFQLDLRGARFDAEGADAAGD
jgi:peptide/nickel transport system substrate-binding protein